MIKRMTFLAMILLVSAGYSQNTPTAKYAIHPEPTQPIYISSAWLEKLKTEIPGFPTKNSAEQKSDEQTLLHEQEIRQPQDCERAKAEIHASLDPFFAAPLGTLTAQQVKTLSPFFEKIRNESNYFTLLIKQEFKRPRPFVYLKDLHPCVDLEKSTAYPSGHASMSELFARVLGEIFPPQKEIFLARAKQIRDDRVLAGVHHPTDIESGKNLGDLIFAELMRSEVFRKDLNAAKINTAVH